MCTSQNCSYVVFYLVSYNSLEFLSLHFNPLFFIFCVHEEIMTSILMLFIADENQHWAHGTHFYCAHILIISQFVTLLYAYMYLRAFSLTF